MRCIDPDKNGARKDGHEGHSVSVIAGDMFFPRNPLDTQSPNPRGADLQVAAFSAALKEVRAIRKKARNVLGNIVLMFDQNGPWDPYFMRTSRRGLRKAQYLNSLLPTYSAPLRKIIERLRLPANLASQIEVIPEEKLKFLFLKLAEDRNLPIDDLLSSSLVIPKLMAGLEKGLLTPSEDDEEDDSDPDTDSNLFTTGVSCGIQPGDAPFERKDLGYKDLLARCRAVAAALTVRAATLPDLERAEIVRAFYQFDPLDPRRVDHQVVLDGAQFAQTHLGVSSTVMTNFFVKHKGGVHVKRYKTEGGKTETL